MKKLTKIVSLLLAVVICVLLPNATALTASAEGPTTYYVKQLPNESDWRFQTGSTTWNESGQHRELYYLYQDIKDGDILIVEGVNTNSKSIIDVPVRLSNLTFISNTSAIVSATSIDECFVLRDTACAISGNVTNAYVYDNATCTFNNNVGTLNVLTDPSRNAALLYGTVTVAGTVDHVIGNDGKTTHYDIYSVASGKLNIQSGALKTDASQYSTSAPATSNTQTNTSSASDEYDDVPKTGDSTLALWLLGISAICFAGRYTLKKAR